MESSARAGKEASNKNPWLWWLLTGLALGIVGTIYIPDLVRPYLPAFLRGENVEISGIVEAKSREADRLLLTIAGSSGAVLVTYTQQIPEMDLLIEPGDSVVLAVREYAPFVEDPSVRRVQKGSTLGRPARPAVAEQETEQPGVERRVRPAEEVMDLEPMQDDRAGDFTREIGPVDSVPTAAVEEAVAGDNQEAPSPQQEGQEEPRK